MEKLKEKDKKGKDVKPKAKRGNLSQRETFLACILVRVGRPVGRKDTVPRMSLREFFEKEIIPLHIETDWEKKAREVRERILRGEFVITGLEDFIGYLYAYMLYEDVPTLFEELFMRPTPPALNLR
jgi:hypothetical protein